MSENKLIFTEDQAKSINEYQESNCFHPLTCCNHVNMVATTQGLICPECGRVQTFVEDWMKNWEWKIFTP